MWLVLRPKHDFLETYTHLRSQTQSKTESEIQTDEADPLACGGKRKQKREREEKGDYVREEERRKEATRRRTSEKRSAAHPVNDRRGLPTSDAQVGPMVITSQRPRFFHSKMNNPHGPKFFYLIKNLLEI